MSNKPSVDNLKNVSRKLGRLKNIRQHESKIMKREKPNFNLIGDEVLTNRMTMTLVARSQAFLLSLRWLLTVRVFQAKSFWALSGRPPHERGKE